MTLTSPSTRNGRGLVVPGIETRGPTEKAAISQPFRDSWPLTPPQSASNSRVPSMAYSSLTHASPSDFSSIREQSQPTTPVHDLRELPAYTQNWIDGINDKGSMSNGADSNYVAGRMMRPMFGSSYANQAPYVSNTVENMQSYSPLALDDSFDNSIKPGSPVHNAWNGVQSVASYGNGPDSGLRSTLFPNCQGLPQQDQMHHSSLYNHPTSSIPVSLGASVFPNYDTTTAASIPPMYPQSQIIVPSQLAPQEDFNMDNYTVCSKAEDMSDGFSHSMDSAASGYSSWESVRPSCETDAYFDATDEDGYVPMHHGLGISSGEGTSSSSSARRVPSQSTEDPYRRTLRRGRRSRKSRKDSKVWFEADYQDITVRCEGRRFCKIGDQIIPEKGRESKPHRCTYRDENGKRCDGAFKRSEHLERHLGKHQSDHERRFPCPLANCEKRIGRSDNATDHFKTHLRGPAPTQRNKHCEMDELADSLNANYDPKTAAKIIAKLNEWLVSGKDRPGAPNARQQQQQQQPGRARRM